MTDHRPGPLDGPVDWFSSAAAPDRPDGGTAGPGAPAHPGAGAGAGGGGSRPVRAVRALAAAGPHDGRGWTGPTQPQPLVTPTAGSPPARPAPPPPDLIGLRNEVLGRLREFSTNHSAHAWWERNQRPISPHGLVFFYADPDPDLNSDADCGAAGSDPVRHRLRVATRLIRAGDDADHLPRLLFELNLRAGEYLAEGVLDPRAQMAVRADDMSDRAFYLGIGVSTLDTPAGRWEAVRSRASGPRHIPGRCLAHLVDGTLLLVDRLAEEHFFQLRVWSTTLLDHTPGRWSGAWQPTDENTLRHDPATRAIWDHLTILHHTIREGTRHGR